MRSGSGYLPAAVLIESPLPACVSACAIVAQGVALAEQSFDASLPDGETNRSEAGAATGVDSATTTPATQMILIVGLLGLSNGSRSLRHTERFRQGEIPGRFTIPSLGTGPSP